MANIPSGLKARFNKRRRSAFVGREDELDAFKRNLESPDDAERWFVLSVVGRHGIGKSHFVRQCEDILRQQNFTVANATARDDFVEILDHLVDQLPVPIWSGTMAKRRFRKLRSRYRTLKAKLEKTDDGVKALKSLAGATTKIIAGAVGGPVAAGLTGAAAEAGMSAVADATDYVRKSVTRANDQNLVLNPESTFTRELIAILWLSAREHRVCLTFDDLDQYEALNANWLPDLLKGVWGDLPDLFCLVSTEKVLPRALWDGDLAYFMREMPLLPLSDEEAQRLLSAKPKLDDEQRKSIIADAGGHPAMLELLARAGGNRDQIVDALLQGDAEHRRLILSAAVPRYLNADVLAAIDDSFAEGAWQRLAKSTSELVERQTGHWAFDRIVRMAILQRFRSESPAAVRAFNERLARWHADTESGGAQRDRIYHLSAARGAKCIDEIVLGLSAFFSQGEHEDVLLALSEARDDYDLTGLAPLAEAWADLSRARLAEDWGAAAAALESIRQHTESDAAAARILGWKAATYVDADDINAALTQIDGALARLPHDPWLGEMRGSLLILAARFEEAATQLGRLIETNNSSSLLRLRATAYASFNPTAAKADLDVLIERRPNDVKALRQRALAYISLTEFEPAEADLKRIISLGESELQDEPTLALVGVRLNRPDAIEKYIETMNRSATKLAEQMSTWAETVPISYLKRSVGGQLNSQGLGARWVDRLFEAVESAPEQIETLLQGELARTRAIQLLQAGQLEQAEVAASEAVKLDPELMEAYLTRSRAALASHGPEHALSLADERLATGGSPYIHLERSLALSRLGREADAREALDAAVASLPDRPEVLGIRARARLASDLEGAIADLERVVELDESDWGAWFTLFYAKVRSDDPAGVADIAEHIARHAGLAIPALRAANLRVGDAGDPFLAEALTNPAAAIRELEGTAARLRALERWDRGEKHAAANDFLKTARKWPDQLPTWLLVYDKFVADPTSVPIANDDPTGPVDRAWHAMVLAARNEVDGALKVLADVNESADFAFPYVLRGLLCLQKKDAEGALVSMDTAVDRFQQVPEVYRIRGEIFQELKRPLDAISDYTEAIDKGLTFDPDTRFRRGELRRQAGDLDAALEDFVVADRVQPDNAVYVGSIGQVLLVKGLWRPALEYLERAVTLQPHIQWLHVERLSARLEAANHVGALEDLDFLEEQNPGDDRAQVTRTNILLSANKSFEALTIAQQLSEKEPDNEDYRLLLATAMIAAGEAQALLDSSLGALESPSPEFRTQFGLAALRIGDSERATAEFKAVAEGAKEGFPFFLLSLGHLAAGDERTATDLLERAFDLDAKQIEAGVDLKVQAILQMNLGLYQTALNRVEAAQAEFAKAIEISSPRVCATVRQELADLRLAGGNAAAINAALVQLDA